MAAVAAVVPVARLVGYQMAAVDLILIRAVRAEVVQEEYPVRLAGDGIMRLATVRAVQMRKVVEVVVAMGVQYSQMQVDLEGIVQAMVRIAGPVEVVVMGET